MPRFLSAAWMAACLLATPAFAETLAGPYFADNLRVVDGDTVDVRVRLWLSLHLRTRVRLHGIDAPELRGACALEKRLARAARDHLAALLASGVVELSQIRPGKYNGRVVAVLRLPTGEDVAAALVAAGHARPVTGPRRLRWCDEGLKPFTPTPVEKPPGDG